MRVPQQLDGATRPSLPGGGSRRACLSTRVWKAARGQTSFTRGSPHGATTPLPPLPAPQHTVGILRRRRHRHRLLLLLPYRPAHSPGPPPVSPWVYRLPVALSVRVAGTARLSCPPHGSSFPFSTFCVSIAAITDSRASLGHKGIQEQINKGSLGDLTGQHEYHNTTQILEPLPHRNDAPATWEGGKGAALVGVHQLVYFPAPL